MPIKLTITVSEEDGAQVVGAGASGDVQARLSDLTERHEELVRQMGDQIAPFPGGGIDGFLSHFIITFEFMKGPFAGRVLTLNMPPSYQTVSRSAAFTYKANSQAKISVPLPPGCTLPAAIAETDFIDRPQEYFSDGHETVWMQILNLDARMETKELGKIRIILGETLKREYPDIFLPSLGVAQSLGKRGFPARLFFNPYAVVETAQGSFRAIHGTLAYGRITGFPPIGTPVTILSMVPMHEVGEVREHMRRGIHARDVERHIEPPVRIIALSHPIDMALQVPGEEAFQMVERGIAEGGEGKKK